ncbi:MAG TPA: N-acetylmannosamine-6-phosphate 2-epimerase [Halanaerobiales bacterium]|nr:N-acetylmannosamine-6-phosphate 2-epimerase [Halanaerobiales bacterium]
MKNLKENSLIVSCQALADEPLHGSEIMAKMALAAKRGGASGVRANSPEDIKAIKNKIELPIIGLWKNKLINYEVYITSKYQHAKAVLKAGADYVAIDCTDRRRPEPLSEIFNKLRTKFPDKGIVADISSTEDFKDIEELAPDYISTTLSGYTEKTQNRTRPDIDLVEKLNMISNIPILAEGNYKNGKQAKKALKAGAYAVVIGAAITRPQVITAHIIENMN